MFAVVLLFSFTNNLKVRDMKTLTYNDFYTFFTFGNTCLYKIGTHLSKQKYFIILIQEFNQAFRKQRKHLVLNAYRLASIKMACLLEFLLISWTSFLIKIINISIIKCSHFDASTTEPMNSLSTIHQWKYIVLG